VSGEAAWRTGLPRRSTDAGECLAALAGLMRELVAGGAAGSLLERVAEETRRLSGAALAVLRTRDGDELMVAAVSREDAGAAEPARLALGEGPEGRIAASGEPLRVADLAKSAVPRDSRRGHPAAGGLRSFAGVPLLVRGRVVGTLGAWAREPDGFTEDDVTVLAGLAGLAAAVLEQARLAQELLHAERVATVGSLVAGVAHELNNPLAAVMGTADLLHREAADPKMAERLRRISGQAQRAGRLVRALLTLARKTPIERTEVDVHVLLDDVVELIGYELQQGRVAVDRRFADALPRVVADPVQLQQVFVNLCLNAVEAMRNPGAGGTLTLATRHDRAARRVVVSVADTGPGIPPAVLERIFEPFFTTKGDGKGTGLGLVICRRIVEDHGGAIRAGSAPGAGATFTVELPAGPVVATAGAAVADPAEAPAPGVRVLVVEDEAVVGDLLEEFLRVEGHAVDRATDGREALERVREAHYGLIVCDVRMPDVDGPAFYRELAGIAPALARRVVFVTGDLLSGETRGFLEATGLRHLEKPFDLGEFRAFVRAALQGG